MYRFEHLNNWNIQIVENLILFKYLSYFIYTYVYLFKWFYLNLNFQIFERFKILLKSFTDSNTWNIKIAFKSFTVQTFE